MKILILTSVYKDEYSECIDKSTNVVNSFAKKWAELNNEVIVIHNAHRYLTIIHKLPKRIIRKLATSLHFEIPDYSLVCPKIYNDGDVIVNRIPFKKYIPHKSPSTKIIEKQESKILSFLKEQDFVPDIIIGHWASPQMEIISKLKNVYNCRTAVVLHGLSYINDKKFKSNSYIKNIDKIGCRSYNMSIEAQKILKLNYIPFICYSGIPDEYLKNYQLNLEKFKELKKWKIVYVGRLIAYKNVDIIMKALSTFKNVDWELTIIGEGPEEENLKNISHKLKVSERVLFLGKITRDAVMKKMEESNMFIMVSSDEVFGLVYLEAMASSCITIASKNGGVDGILVDNYNGYLCEQGDTNSLISKLEFIFQLDEKDRNKIVESAYNTVNDYSDSNVAMKYLKNITGGE